MQRWIACFAYCLLIQQTSFSFCQETRVQEPHGPSLIARSGWVRFQLALGRIEVANIHSSQTRVAKRGTIEEGLFEKLSITGDTEIPSVRYERTVPNDSLTLVVINGKRVEIDRKVGTGDNARHIKFRQRGTTDITFRIESEANNFIYKSPSIWHLMVSSPQAFRDDLSPMLEMIQPSWDFGQLSTLTTDELVRQAQSSDFDLRHKARRFVVKLASDDFKTRRLAQRSLRELGLPVVPYLERVSKLGMTREQQRRVERIIDEIKGDTPDSPSRVALWLVEDEAIWLSMLGHDELPIREFAAAHLSKRFTKPIGFDPKGSERDRLQQIASLRSRLMLR